jgi:molecular chaperone HscB
MSPDFLMEQMEWREALGEATDAADEDALDELSRRLRQHAGARGRARPPARRDGDLEGAADSVRRMKFLEKLQHEINDALTALES